jgi:hypothetical protein
MKPNKMKGKSARDRGFKLVSFEIEPDTWDEFRILAIRQKTSSSELLRDLVRGAIKRRKG